MKRFHSFTIVGLLMCIAITSWAESPSEVIRPRGLKPGDTIMFVAPAGSLIEERMTLAAERLRAMGFKVRVPKNLYRESGYLAGSDEQRAAELMQAFADPEVDAIFPGTGGYGVMRILDRLDWEVIRANPKMVIGFSDITALHLAIAAKANFATIHSPNPQWGLGSEGNLAPFAAKSFWRAVLLSENKSEAGYSYDQPESLGPREQIAGGKATGTITGGNLSLVAALTGTPYEVNTAGKILFLEDIGEEPYRVDRMLAQLKLAGKLDHCSGVLLGQFTKRKSQRDNEADEQDTNWQAMRQVFEDYFANAPYPVIANFPAGHAKMNATLPFGVTAAMDADRLEVRMIENPVIESVAE